MKKKTLIIILVVLTVLVLAICGPLIYILLSVQLQKSPPKPQIKYGEFDYSLVYSVSGEEIRADGTLIFEYDGVSKQLNGVSNKWKTYIKGTKEAKILVSENEEGKIYIFLPADARYYMDDPGFELAGLQIQEKPWFVYEANALSSSSEEEQKALRGLEIVEWEIEEPIENVYE